MWLVYKGKSKLDEWDFSHSFCSMLIRYSLVTAWNINGKINSKKKKVYGDNFDNPKTPK